MKNKNFPLIKMISLLCLIYILSGSNTVFANSQNSADPLVNEEVQKQLGQYFSIERKFQRFMEIQIIASAITNEEKNLIPDPNEEEKYLDAHLAILSMLKNLYSDDPESQKVKEQFSLEKEEYLKEGLIDLNFPHALNLLPDVVTRQGSNFLSQMILENNAQMSFASFLTMNLDLLDYGQLNSQEKIQIEENLNRIINKSTSMRGREFLLNNACESIEANPYPILRERKIQLNSTPIDFGALSFVTGVDEEKKLWLFVFYEGQILTQRQVAKINGKLPLLTGQCPHILTFNSRDKTINFVSDSLVFNGRRDGHIKSLQVYNGDFDNRVAFEVLKEKIEQYITSNNESLRFNAIDYYGRILENSSDLTIRREICSRLVALYKNENIPKSMHFYLTNALAQGGSMGMENLVDLLVWDYQKNDGQLDNENIRRAIDDSYTKSLEWPASLNKLLEQQNNEDLLSFSVHVIGHHSEKSVIKAQALNYLMQIGYNRSLSIKVRTLALRGMQGPEYCRELYPYLLDFITNTRAPIELRKEAFKTLSTKPYAPILDLFLAFQTQHHQQFFDLNSMDLISDYLALILDQARNNRVTIGPVIDKAIKLFTEILANNRGYTGFEKSLNVIFSLGSQSQALQGVSLLTKYRQSLPEDNIGMLIAICAHQSVITELVNMLESKQAQALKSYVLSNFYNDLDRAKALRNIANLRSRSLVIETLESIILSSVEERFKLAALQIFYSRANPSEFSFLNQNFNKVRRVLILDSADSMSLFVCLAYIKQVKAEESSEVLKFLDHLLDLPGYVSSERLNAMADVYVYSKPNIRPDLLNIYQAHIPSAETQFWKFLKDNQ